jgi:hypothetical protein
MRRHDQRDVVAMAADGEQRSKIGHELAFAAQRRSIPEWVGRVHLLDSGKHHPHWLRVLLAPECKVRGGKMVPEWRRERRGEHEIAKVVEAEDENPTRLADMALHVSHD